MEVLDLTMCDSIFAVLAEEAGRRKSSVKTSAQRILGLKNCESIAIDVHSVGTGSEYLSVVPKLSRGFGRSEVGS